MNGSGQGSREVRGSDRCHTTSCSVQLGVMRWEWRNGWEIIGIFVLGIWVASV